MSTVVAVVGENDGVVYMQGDRAGTTGSGRSIVLPADTKAFKHGDAVVGLTGDLRSVQLVRYGTPPLQCGSNRPPEQESTLLYLIAEWVPHFLEALDKHVDYKNPENELAMSVLIGLDGALFEVDATGGIAEIRDGFYAIGSGAPYALGAMHSTVSADGLDNPATVIAEGLNAAITFDAYTAGVGWLQRSDLGGTVHERSLAQALGMEE